MRNLLQICSPVIIKLFCNNLQHRKNRYLLFIILNNRFENKFGASMLTVFLEYFSTIDEAQSIFLTDLIKYLSAPLVYQLIQLR